MEPRESDRRISRRHLFKIPLRVRVCKSGPAERCVESENLSEKGAFFSTDTPLSIGSSVEILLRMPEQISGKPATDWRCTAHVVRIEPADCLRSKLGVGVEFDYHEILLSKAEISPDAGAESE